MLPSWALNKGCLRRQQLIPYHGNCLDLPDYCGEAAFTLDRSAPSWHNGFGFATIGMLSAAMGLQGVVGESLGTGVGLAQPVSNPSGLVVGVCTNRICPCSSRPLSCSRAHGSSWPSFPARGGGPGRATTG